MTLTIELPDNLASQLMTRTTKEERNAFVVEAVADALNPLSDEGEERFVHDGGIFVGGKPLSKEEQEGEARLLAALNAELDPEKEPERDAAECKRIVDAEIADMDAGIGKSYTLEETWEWLDAQWAARQAAKSA